MSGMPGFGGNTPKFVYVVLSRSKSALSGAIIALTGDLYTHSALALDKELEFMYSFGRRKPGNPFVGCFKQEKLDDSFYTRHKRLPGAVLEIAVSQRQYRDIAGEIGTFLADGERFGYNIWGMLTAGFRRREACRDRKFFCSEFVYHLLRKNGVCDLGMPRSSVRPQHLLAIDAPVIFEGNLLEYPHQSEEYLQAPMPVWT